MENHLAGGDLIPAQPAARHRAEPRDPAGVGTTTADDSWQKAWAHREALLRVALRRSLNHADAEDAVSEAIARSHEHETVDVNRVGGWLTSVTMRLCVDDARDRARDPKRLAYQVRQGMTSEDHATAVCDRAEASWLATHLDGLPERQRRALELRAAGADISSIAMAMGVTYKVAERLLERARNHMRTVLKAAAAWLGIMVGALVTALRRRTGTTATLATVAAASAVIVSGGLPSTSPPVSPVVPAEYRSAPVTASVVVPDETVAESPAPSPSRVQAQVDDIPPPRLSPLATAAAQPSLPLPPVAVSTRAPSRRSVGPLEAVDGGSTRHQSDQSFVQSLESCLEEGPAVSLETVGCPPVE